MRTLTRLYDATLNNVKFGIALMVLIGLYIALGSGVTSLRAAMDMTTMEFFNAWPLMTLMGLLVLNLMVVTFGRIPFTPPRYGVWMVHAGIVTLVFGMAFYFRYKVEGRAMIRLGQQASHFYDAEERSLYARVAGTMTSEPLPLRGLPRYNIETSLDRTSLHNLQLNLWQADERGNPTLQPLSQVIGLNAPLSIDVVGYWPYASVDTHFERSDDSSIRHRPVIQLSQLDPKTLQPVVRMMRADDAGRGLALFDVGIVMEHRDVPDADMLARLSTAAGQLHILTVSVDGKEAFRGPVRVGQAIDVAGYQVHVAEFQPQFIHSQTGKPYPAMTLHINTPQRQGEGVELLATEGGVPGTFNRMVLAGLDTQTDFKLGEPGAGPLGKRQATPIDPHLKIEYAVNDPLGLLPREDMRIRHVLATSPGVPGVLHLAIAVDHPPLILSLPTGRGEIVVSGQLGPQPLLFERKDGLVATSDVHITPANERDNNEGETGLHQVLQVRLRSGDWEQTIPVPFSRFAWQEPWRSESITVPGGSVSFQLVLGNTKRPLPVLVELDRFEAVPYPGGEASAGSLMRDFRSYLTLRNSMSGETWQDIAQLNDPAYFTLGGTIMGASWLLFQAEWDPEGQNWTVLGVGNRPGVWTMTSGCVLIAIGLGYAFYLKPLIIRRMKRNAIESARAKGKRVPPQLTPAGSL